MQGLDVDLSYRLYRVEFGIDAASGTKCATVLGSISNADLYLDFHLTMEPLRNGKWRYQRIQWYPNSPRSIDQTSFLQSLVNKAATFLSTTNMWVAEQAEKGARLSLNQNLVPAEDLHTNTVSFRSNLLSSKSPKWGNLWDLIDGRLLADPYFRVHGFSSAEISAAVAELRGVFTAEWVRARYRDASTTRNPPGMGDDFTPEEKGWFPAYHLARTALGAICVDPGWNYLIEIGLAVGELKGFKNLKRLLDQLCRSPGTQHHLCLAAELFKNGYLMDLEQATESGSARNDLLVKTNGNEYAVEVKELVAGDPLRTIERELHEKSTKLPARPGQPVVFHVVLREEVVADVEKEKTFVGSMDDFSQHIPPKISALVIGSRLIDSLGGRLKRETKRILLNPHAIQPSLMADLETLFANNFEEISYPCFGIGTLFYFSHGPAQSEG